MIVHTGGKRHGVDIIRHDALDMTGRITYEQSAGARVQLPVKGFHGLVEEDFMTPVMNGLGQLHRIGQMGQNRKGQIR